MTGRLRFFKLSGAGNDFVLIEGPVKNAAKLARRLCDRRRGIGADGLLVVSKKPAARLSYFNADGSEAFCGNGTRCAAWWLKAKGGLSRKQFFLETSAGAVEARILGPHRAAIAMPAPKKISLGLDLTAAGRRLTVHALNTGVPHAVVFVDGLKNYPVAEVGSALRCHEVFGKDGANVDFALVKDGGLSLRTFERGVEAETLACGTGAVAAAAAANLLKLAESPVSVRVLGGELRVAFKRAGGEFSDVWLEGPALMVFAGEISL